MSSELWECPDCAFAFDAEHRDVDSDGYSCPSCAEALLSAEVERLTKANDELLTMLGQCSVFTATKVREEMQTKIDALTAEVTRLSAAESARP